MAVTAGMVKELREMTGAGMMDCKKALAATDGDMDKAVEFLREKGLAGAAKKAGRIAAEGVVVTALTADEKKAVVVEVNAETDFVAKNEKFQTYAADVAAQALKTTAADMDAFMAEKWEQNPEETVQEALVEITSVISEKLSIRRFEKVTAENGIVVPYLHGAGRIAVLVEAATDVVNDDIKEALKNIAMQVAALAPKYVDMNDVSEEYRNHEKEILLAQALNENEELPEDKRKPQQIIEKMLIGRLSKELKEICLNEQIYVKAEDGKQTVAQYVAQVAKQNGANLSIKKFVRFETGEGIEKKNENFAEEVAKQAGMTK